jgi:hypothetical protein
MNALLRSAYLHAGQLQESVETLTAPGLCFILEGLDRLCIGRIGPAGGPPDAAQRPQDLEQGHLFGPDFELRWRRLRGYPADTPPFRVRLIQDRDTPPPPALAAQSPRTVERAGDGRNGADSGIYLWGQPVADRKPSAWYEKRVPRFWEYPAAPGAASRVKLYTRAYLLPAAGPPSDTEPVTLLRFLAFEPE